VSDVETVVVPTSVVLDAIALLQATADDRRGANETIEALRKTLPAPEVVEEPS